MSCVHIYSVRVNDNHVIVAEVLRNNMRLVGINVYYCEGIPPNVLGFVGRQLSRSMEEPASTALPFGLEI